MKTLIGSAVLVASAALFWSTAGAGFQAVEPHRDLLRMFPPDTGGITFIDVMALEEAGFFEGIASGFIAEQAEGRIPVELEEFVAKTGFDPVRDIRQLMIGVSPESGVLVVANAVFDRPRLDRYFLEAGFPSTSVGAYSLIVPDPDQELAFALLDDMIVLGPSPAATAALERFALSGPSALTNASLKALIAELDVAGNPIWGTGVVGGIPTMGIEGMAPPMALDLISALQRITYEMGFDTHVRARFYGEFTGADTAMRAGDLLRGFVALGKMGSAEQPDLAELLNGVQITNVENAIDIRFSASLELLDRLSDSAEVELPEIE